MNRNVKDYLILKADFDFAIPWITLLGLPEPARVHNKTKGALVHECEQLTVLSVV